MSGVKDSFSDLERHRLQLEDQVKKLRKALQHWQTWDAEYEALKEEVDVLREATPTSLSQVRDDFDGELLKQHEIDDIFGGQSLRSKDQIKNVLERRVDYVTQNIESLQKQLEAAENKYAAATVISQPDATDEEGQPITEIIEQLDDDDNVISYRLNKPGDALPQVKEALEKAGVEDFSEAGSALKQQNPQQQPPRQQTRQQLDTQVQPATKKVQEPFRSPSPANKAVSFAPDTKGGEAPGPQVSRNAKRVEEIMKTAKEQENLADEEPVVPEDEDEDDAEMRRQMLAYGMGEVSAVVAELELDDGETDDDEYVFDYSDEGFEDEEEDEDKYGRFTGSVLTDGYRQRMLELEKKLGVKSRFTTQEQADEDGEPSSDDERIGRIVVKPIPQGPSSALKSTPSKSNIKEKQSAEVGGKKGVRFASNLDIAPENDEPAVQPVTEVADKDNEPLVEPLSDVVERSGPAKSAEPKTNRRPSRFKKSRGEAPANDSFPSGPLDMPTRFLDQDRPTAPTGPAGTTIADTLVERETSAAPGEFDDDVTQEAVADEYHRMRNKFIQRDGGFLKEDESPRQPLDEAEGGPERVSRFKAAKLSRQ